MTAPYIAQDPVKVASLVTALTVLANDSGAPKSAGTKQTEKSPKCRRSTFEVVGTKHVIDSWQFREWDYGRELPVYARGLFTYQSRDGLAIAARGYDKFYNVGEVAETLWSNIDQLTSGPYEISVKENGCIILIAGLEGDKLLVCSKHSTGPSPKGTISHAIAGERWVDKILQQVGKSRTDLARELRTRNITAVAEYCDDAFEEHVLAYDTKDAGLYLHGINVNVPEFVTYSSNQVQEFAQRWGFRKTEFIVKDELSSTKAFLEECAVSGSFRGRETEGFVVRCIRTDGKAPKADWFFKYKFEEPYLMYRQWRECTKDIIDNRPPRYRKHEEITERYLHYARQQFAKNPRLTEDYYSNHGIIAMREGFLKECGMSGAEIIRTEVDKVPTNNLVLVPVASIGCGKTTVALVLARLFGWGHVQNDNITARPNKPKQFATLVCNALAEAPVCFADRNNHQKRERKQLVDDVARIIPRAKFVALHYSHDGDRMDEVRKVTRQRILARGDNHQTIQAGSKSHHEIFAIMDGFLRRFEPVEEHAPPDNAFARVITLNASDSTYSNVLKIITTLHQHYPRIVSSVPDQQVVEDAIISAMRDYQPDIKHEVGVSSKKKEKKAVQSSGRLQGSAQQLPPRPPKLEYFCIKVPVTSVLSATKQALATAPPEKGAFFGQLEALKRVQNSMHVTLIHRASIDSSPDLWQHMSKLHLNAITQAATTTKPTFDPLLGKCRVRLESVVWNDRVMCVVVRILDTEWTTANETAHITIGTIRPDVKPKESNELLKAWLADGDGVHVLDIEGHVEVFGEVRAVMQHGR